ncbi:hypothetical protein CS063_01670 [Sporanaerobium hydrogeniformans]|uniref:Uncharacterized protein n=1 Tax=Sporanaerobium hydrogeniformans TaxID=3072179 RepID=A0AC61DG11_9FIRM|nr:hypothetical protein [Sporanaerobium hydrogeniformans]PHV72209.1 hypothetical protein CS063_01670 [Sporanaerobium hydrogeniformans]
MELTLTKTMTISDYFKMIKPEYVYLKLIPDTSIRNYNSSALAKMIANMYQGINKRIYKQEKTWCFKSPMRCSYFIDIQKNDVSFYFIVPGQYESIAREKISSVWPRVTIEKTDKVKEFEGDKVSYNLGYKKEDALSLDTDARGNTLLSSILNIVDVIEEEDRVGIFYNFVPINQRYWNADYKHTLDKWKQYKPLDRNKVSVGYLLKYSAICLLWLIQSVLDGICDAFGENKNEVSTLTNLTDALNRTRIELSEQTKRKKNEIILDTQIAILGSGPNLSRSKSNVISVCQGFNSIEGDNELIYKENKKFEALNDSCVYRSVERNKMSVSECQNLLQLPGRELLEKHKIEHINTLEVLVPEELQKGVMCIGESTYKGNSIKAYLSMDRNFKYLTTCVIGPTRAGKTTLISNMGVDSARASEINVFFDWCGNCELTEEVKVALQKQGIKCLVIDCSDPKDLQGLGYNELYSNSNDVFDRYRSSKAQSSQLMTLINSVQGDETELRARMERYLEAAAVTVFISNGPIRDVFGILQRHQLRAEYINKIPTNQQVNCQEYIEALNELDEVDKKSSEVIGTKISAIQGILNRANKLKQNTYVEMMLKKDCSKNFNLTEEIMKSQAIFIKMPETMFSTEIEKDIYATYWLTKLWAALQQRKWLVKELDNLIKVNMYFDELYQTPNCQDFLRSKLSQIAKFGAKPIISCHYLGQIPIIRGELKAANTSYMLIAGCDKMNYNELKEELDPYNVDDLLHMKRYHSLNLIKTSDGYARFITKLPRPIS